MEHNAGCFLIFGSVRFGIGRRVLIRRKVAEYHLWSETVVGGENARAAPRFECDIVADEILQCIVCIFRELSVLGLFRRGVQIHMPVCGRTGAAKLHLHAEGVSLRLCIKGFSFSFREHAKSFSFCRKHDAIGAGFWNRYQACTGIRGERCRRGLVRGKPRFGPRQPPHRGVAPGRPRLDPHRANGHGMRPYGLGLVHSMALPARRDALRAYTASAPEMISISSLVICACRVRL